MGIIYKAINIKNGKEYIGKTTNTLDERKKEHRTASKIKDYPFYMAIKKYGWRAFEWEILCEDVPADELNYWEIFCIREWGSYTTDGGYNATRGGDAGPVMCGADNYMFGKTHTPEAKAKISATHKGKTISEEHKKKISAYMKGRPSPTKGKKHTEETKRKMSEASKGNTYAKALKGKPKTPEHRE